MCLGEYPQTPREGFIQGGGVMTQEGRVGERRGGE